MTKEEIEESKKYADKSMELVDLILKANNMDENFVRSVATIMFDVYQLGFNNGTKHALGLLDHKVSVKLFDKE